MALRKKKDTNIEKSQDDFDEYDGLMPFLVANVGSESLHNRDNGDRPVGNDPDHEVPNGPIDVAVDSESDESSGNGHKEITRTEEAHEDDSQATLVVPSVLPSSLYLITKQGVALKKDPQYIREMATKMHEKGMNKFVVFDGSIPALIACMPKEETINPLLLPDPARITTTPPQLYAKAITYAKVVTRLVKRRLAATQDSFVKTSKMIWVIALSVITLFIIFMLVVVAVDSFSSSDENETNTGTTNQQVVPVNPSGQGPELEISPNPTQQGTVQEDPRVIVPLAK